MGSLDDITESAVTAGDRSGLSLLIALKVASTSRGSQNSQELLESSMRFIVELAGMNGFGIVLMLASIGISIAWDLPYRKIRMIEVIKNYEKVIVLKEEAAMAELEMQALLRTESLRTSASDIKE
ncbi:hypothetical protein BC830DRAFT_1173788 [Chytriomyces sp. MP71]|nr:hypothetical protein BC830DRAFT_1173788 [Chytriomyces sp. MP71]